jgi:hypothetical protein
MASPNTASSKYNATKKPIGGHSTQMAKKM